jgi:hypothetical protein
MWVSWDALPLRGLVGHTPTWCPNGPSFTFLFYLILWGFFMKVRPCYFVGPKSHPRFWLKFLISILQKLDIPSRNNGRNENRANERSRWTGHGKWHVFVGGTPSWLVRAMHEWWENLYNSPHITHTGVDQEIMRGTFLEKRALSWKTLAHHHFHHHFSIAIILIWTLQPLWIPIENNYLFSEP